jgi:uncharacterized protein (TIGR03435 family)
MAANMTKFVVIVCFAVVLARVEVGQGRAQSLPFEAASVKLSRDQERQRGVSGMPPPIPTERERTLVYTHVTLMGVVVRAYGISPSEVVGPSWLSEKFYDIVAKVPPGASPTEIPAMLQSLLAERFRVHVHWADQQKAGHALAVARSGPRLAPATPDHILKPQESYSVSHDGLIRFEYKAVTLEAFAKRLTSLLGQPVADQTGIKGMFDITIECSSDSLPGFQKMSAAEDAEPAPSVVSAIRGLGLDLVSAKVPVRHLVVDSANAVPTEN